MNCSELVTTWSRLPVLSFFCESILWSVICDWERGLSAMALRFLSRKNLKPTISGAFGSGHFRGLQTVSLPGLPYDYGALEPVINAEIMQLHHQKHHQAYITNYNKALEQLHDAINKGDTTSVVKLQSAIKFNGGGFSFCSLFFWFSNYDAYLIPHLCNTWNQIYSLN